MRPMILMCASRRLKLFDNIRDSVKKSASLNNFESSRLNLFSIKYRYKES